MSGKLPAEQHTRCPGVKEEQRFFSVLYFVKSLAEMPHLVARAAQLSLELTVVVLQSLRFESLSGTAVVLVEVERRGSSTTVTF